MNQKNQKNLLGLSSFIFQNYSKKFKIKRKPVSSLTEKITITGNARELETGYEKRPNQENENFNRNLKRIYDNGHDKYKHKESVDKKINITEDINNK